MIFIPFLDGLQRTVHKSIHKVLDILLSILSSMNCN